MLAYGCSPELAPALPSLVLCSKVGAGQAAEAWWPEPLGWCPQSPVGALSCSG